MRAMARQDPLRQWTAISLRLVVLLLLVLALGGARWERRNKNLEVVVVRDISGSTQYVHEFPDKTLQSSIDQWLTTSASDSQKPRDDTVGIVSFDEQARVDAMPSPSLRLDQRSTREPGSGTDVAGALTLAQAMFHGDAMHRIVLAWDGNATSGDLSAQLHAAAASHIPIDVMPLHYNVDNSVLMERLIAPTSRRKNEPFTLDVILQNRSPLSRAGTVRITANNQIIANRYVTLIPGANLLHFAVPGQEAGLQRFHAAFEPDSGGAADQALSAIRSADAFTFIRGKGKVLYVDATEAGGGNSLLKTLASQGIEIAAQDRISPDQFPRTLTDLQAYDAIILANVSRGAGGLDAQQEKALCAYVQDTGGGLVMVGGPSTFGAGGWIGSELETILPVNCSVPGIRQLPAGALVLVIDHSGSMAEGLRGSSASKQQIANEAAILALRTLTPQDYFGVIAFDSSPTWIVPLGINTNPNASVREIRSIAPAGGTIIYPSLVSAYEALSKVKPEDAGIKHVILLTDGDSTPGDYRGILAKMNGAKITLSAVGVGDDADVKLLSELAAMGKGRFYAVTNPKVLPQVFIKEASVLRRPLIKEDPDGIAIKLTSSSDMTSDLSQVSPVNGMVLTTIKPDPQAELAMVAGPYHDPILARWRAGLGRVAVFTSDAGPRWASQWIASPDFGKFWTQIIRSVQRAPISNEVDLRSSVDGTIGHIELRAVNPDDSFRNFLSVECTVLLPDLSARLVQLQQTGPGTDSGSFAAGSEGQYIIVAHYRGRDGKSGTAFGGMGIDAAREMRDLQSNEAQLNQVVEQTGGRMLAPFAPNDDLFSREGLWPSASRRPIWDILIPLAMVAMLLDVAARRIAWDRYTLRSLVSKTIASVHSFTQTTRAVPPTAVPVALIRQKRQQQAAQSANPRTKFEGAAIQGDINRLVGGATVKTQTSADQTRSGGKDSEESNTLSSLRRAKQQARDRLNQLQKPLD